MKSVRERSIVRRRLSTPRARSPKYVPDARSADAGTGTGLDRSSYEEREEKRQSRIPPLSRLFAPLRAHAWNPRARAITLDYRDSLEFIRDLTRASDSRLTYRSDTAA